MRNIENLSIKYALEHLKVKTANNSFAVENVTYSLLILKNHAFMLLLWKFQDYLSVLMKENSLNFL